MIESALRKAMTEVVDDYPGTYDPNVMDELRKDEVKKEEIRKGYESVRQVAFPFHREAKLFSAEVEGSSRGGIDVTPYDSTDYYARLYPLMGKDGGGGWTDCETLSEYGACDNGRWLPSSDFWPSVLKCFDDVSTKSFIVLYF